LYFFFFNIPPYCPQDSEKAALLLLNTNYSLKIYYSLLRR